MLVVILDIFIGKTVLIRFRQHAHPQAAALRLGLSGPYPVLALGMRSLSPAHRTLREALYDLSVTFSAGLFGDAGIERKGIGVLVLVNDDLIIGIILQCAVIETLGHELCRPVVAPRLK